MQGDRWYEKLRSKHRPKVLRILLIGESPPDPRNRARRFFFSPILSKDNLYRSVALAVYGNEVSFDVSQKSYNLQRLKEDGFWLIDAVSDPINLRSTAERRRAIRDRIPHLINRVRRLAPRDGMIICHGIVYRECADALINSGVTVLHDHPLPFPLGNHRKRFVSGMRSALARAYFKREPA